MSVFKKPLFIRFSIFTIVAVYLVIIAGGVVRSTGSGMGCPDWPKCFGNWVPPTDISQLPANYVEQYSHGGQLTVEFNVYKTWTEYINRLVGVFVGFFIFLTLIFSFSYWQEKKSIVYWSSAAFILVGLQGWIGARVVASNLKPYMVTIHMLIALLILAILLFAVVLAKIKANVGKVYSLQVSPFWLWLAGSISVVQILIGTQVRQAVDVAALNFAYQSREMWAGALGDIFTVHRLFAYIVVGVNFFIAYKLHKMRLFTLRNSIVACVVLEFATGLILTYFAIPSYIQPVHLVIASVLFGIQFFVLAEYYVANTETVNNRVLASGEIE